MTLSSPNSLHKKAYLSAGIRAGSRTITHPKNKTKRAWMLFSPVHSRGHRQGHVTALILSNSGAYPKHFLLTMQCISNHGEGPVNTPLTGSQVCLHRKSVCRQYADSRHVHLCDSTQGQREGGRFRKTPLLATHSGMILPHSNTRVHRLSSMQVSKETKDRNRDKPPKTVNWSVLGMGVAVETITCGARSFALSKIWMRCSTWVACGNSAGPAVKSRSRNHSDKK